MADNVVLNSGTGGATLAADDIGGIHYQRFKLNVGADGTTQDVDNGQQLMTNSIPVVVASDQSNMNVVLATALPVGTNNIGDVDVVTIPVRDQTTDTLSVALQSDAIMKDTTKLVPKFANILLSVSGNSTIVSAVGGAVIKVISIALFSSGQTDIYWNDGTDDVFGDSTRKIKMDNAGAVGVGGFVLNKNEHGWFETNAVNRPLRINSANAIALAGRLCYVEYT